LSVKAPLPEPPTGLMDTDRVPTKSVLITPLTTTVEESVILGQATVRVAPPPPATIVPHDRERLGEVVIMRGVIVLSNIPARAGDERKDERDIL